MLTLTLFVSGSALFDSIATTQQIIILILLFSTETPIRTSLGYILGVTLTYLVCGLIGLAFVDRLNEMLRMFLPNLDAIADPAYYQAQGWTGLILVVAGPLYWFIKSRSRRPPMENQIFSRIKRMNFWVAFALGALLSSTSFPAALPYVAAIEKIAAAHLSLPMAVGFLLLYNLVYALPMLVPFALFVVLKDGILPKLHLHVRRLNVVLTIVMLSGMGLFLVADSAAYFFWAKPLLTTRFL